MPVVLCVNRSPEHLFSKQAVSEIVLVQGEGVEGDAHRGKTVKHRSRVKTDPTQPNLRQVHLIHVELFEELEAKGFQVDAASLGENITTQGIDLLALPEGAVLRIGADAVLSITGLRNPCKQIDDFQAGLMKAVLGRDAEGNLLRKTGVMAVVVNGGRVVAGDNIAVELPSELKALQPV